MANFTAALTVATVMLVVTAGAAAQGKGLRIAVLEGGAASGNVAPRTEVPTLVQVRGRNELPTSGPGNAVWPEGAPPGGRAVCGAQRECRESGDTWRTTLAAVRQALWPVRIVLGAFTRSSGDESRAATCRVYDRAVQASAALSAATPELPRRRRRRERQRGAGCEASPPRRLPIVAAAPRRRGIVHSARAESRSRAGSPAGSATSAARSGPAPARTAPSTAARCSASARPSTPTGCR